MSSPPSTKKLKVTSSAAETINSKVLDGLFKGYSICLVEQGLGKIRHSVLEKQLIKHGAVVTKFLTNKTSHIIVASDSKKEKILKRLKVKTVSDNIKFVKVDWISACLVKGELVDIDLYLVFKGVSLVNSPKTDEVKGIEKDKAQPVDEKTNTTDLKTESSAVHDIFSLPEKSSESFVYSKPSSSRGTNHNEYITDKLAILQKNYTNTQDRWRAFGYKKAIASIQNYHKPLESYEEVCQLPCVGERLAKKIWEIIETGHLRRLDHVDEKVELLNLFAGVWGAGPKTAEIWIAKGYKSLNDLRTNADLTSQQRIGLNYYDDINEKMSRFEVAEIESHIRVTAEQLLKGVSIVICGSYRRGRDYCGDIDVLVSHPDGHSHKGFLQILLEKLKNVGLITDDLIKVENAEQRKYMGVCKLPGPNQKYRRIDFIVAPYNEWPLALVHFTGSAHLNRSMRLNAKKKNMSLSEHALRKNVVYGPGDEKLHQGEAIPIFDEKDIFKHLGLDYLEPSNRDW